MALLRSDYARLRELLSSVKDAAEAGAAGPGVPPPGVPTPGSADGAAATADEAGVAVALPGRASDRRTPAA